MFEQGGHITDEMREQGTNPFALDDDEDDDDFDPIGCGC